MSEQLKLDLQNLIERVEAVEKERGRTNGPSLEFALGCLGETVYAMWPTIHDALARRAPSPSAIVAALEKERARWYAHHLNDNPFDGGYTSGLTKAIDIVKELSK